MRRTRTSRWATPAGITSMLGYGLGALVPPEPASPSGKFLDATGSWSTPAGEGGVTFGGVVTETAFGQASSAGTSQNASRADHTHGTPAAPTAASVGAVAVTLTTTKGDIIVDDGTDPVRVAVGSPGRTLYAKPAATPGLAWGIPVWMQTLYGTGADGNLMANGVDAITIGGVSHSPSSGVYTLTVDCNAQTLTMSGTAQIRTIGFRLRCWKLIGAASNVIHDDGNAPASATVGGAQLTDAGTLQRWGTAGSNSKTSAGAGINSANVTLPSRGGRGGQGGSSPANHGGTTGTVAAATAIMGPYTAGGYLLDGWLGGSNGPGSQEVGGASGGSSGGVGVAGGTSGPGGGGAGRCLVWALECDFAGTIRANGGPGGAATAGDAGGGGGGGGGEVVLYTEILTQSPTLDAAGGAGAAGIGTGNAGANGGAGTTATVSPGT